MRSLGNLISRFPRSIVLAWVLATVIAFAIALGGIGSDGLFARLSGGIPTIPGAESQIAADLLEEESEAGDTITLAAHGLDPAEPELAEILERARTETARITGVESVVDPTALPGGVADPSAQLLLAQDGSGLLLITTLEPHLGSKALESATEETVAAYTAAEAEIARAFPEAETHIGGESLILDDILDQVKTDLIRGEAVALPLSLLIMLVVFGGFLAAGMPLLGALSSIGAGLFAIFSLTHFMDVDSAVVNVASVLGLGLSIDYGLLIVSRYREELHRLLDHAPEDLADSAALSTSDSIGDGAASSKSRRSRDPVVRQALGTTMETAGRTVSFSSLIVAISLSGLLVFRPSMLKAISIASIAVVLVALLTALTLVPALLALTGRRLLAPSPIARLPWIGGLIRRLGDTAPEKGVFSALATWTQRRPWLITIGAAVVLIALAIPLTHIQLRNSAMEMLPADSPQRSYLELMSEQYPQAAQPEITVLADTTVAEAQEWSESLTDIAGVGQVFPSEAVGTYAAVAIQIDPLSKVNSAGESDATGPPSAVDLNDIERSVVRDLRAPENHPDFEIWVTGTAAHELDFTDALLEGAPAAISIVVVATLVLLFLMTGSVILPFKALIINLFSLAAALGILVWGFQDGHLSGLLGFTPMGGIETYVLAVVVAFGFGLAMDYEVFLLSRIQEAHAEAGGFEAGISDDAAVRDGLQRSGRIITAAALILVIVFSGFVTGELQVIKQAGVALAVAIAVDATLVRMLLVPATMTLLGKWNWWAPAPLRKLHSRIGIKRH